MKFRVFNIKENKEVDTGGNYFFVLSETGTLLTVDRSYFEIHEIDEKERKNLRIEYFDNGVVI